MRRVTLTAALALCAAGAAQVALADSHDNQPLSRKVSYADLNLSNPEGARTLYLRLDAAAGVVCEPFAGRDVASDTRFRACVREALATAVADVNSPLLTSYYRSKGHLPEQRVAQLVK